MQSEGKISVSTLYRVRCFRRDGSRRWAEEFKNLVVNTGLSELMTRLVKTVPADVNWYVGLKLAGTPAAGDTMASHAGWSEDTDYGEGSRPAFTPGTVTNGVVSNTASKATFTINADGDIFGAFFTSDNTKGGAAGTLYGVGDFTNKSITGATQANPCSITSTAHGLVTGNRVRIQDVVGMTELNGNIYTVTSTGANTFTLDGIDSTAYGAYVSGGTWSKVRIVENGDTLDVEVTLSATAA